MNLEYNPKIMDYVLKINLEFNSAFHASYTMISGWTIFYIAFSLKK